MANEVSIENLRRVCEQATVGCNSTAELQALEKIIGQDRAVRSLHFGLGIQALGFNIFVAGLPGTGRTTAVKSFLEEEARGKPVPPDWCYVYNFRNVSQPRAISLPAGRARQFQADMKSLVEGAQREIRMAFESEEYSTKREEAAGEFQKQKEDLGESINQRARQEGFIIRQTAMGIVTIPVKNDHPLTEEEFMALKEKDREALHQKQKNLQAEIETALRQIKTAEKSANEQLNQMDRQVALYALSHLLHALQDKYQDLPEILAYLEEVRDDILANLDQFRGDEKEQPALPFPLPGGGGEQLMRRYAVNVLVDNSSLQGAPVVIELNPTYNNLFGRIENEARFGALVTDFTLIQQGSLHRANGGYLVLAAEEVVRNPFSWESLKRALRNREIAIEDQGERLGFMTTRSLRSEPVPLQVKVVLIGKPDVYNLLYVYDEDFRELFKVKADFDSRMERTQESINQYAAFASTVCAEGSMKHLDASAIAKLVEYGSRLAEDQNKLSTRFGEISDVIREASYYATQSGVELTTGAHIRQAIEERFYRSNLIQERIGESIHREILKIEVSGEKVGQVNGLSVIELGDVAFGQPSRITATVGVGREGLVDIEREARLGGPIHTKGVLILAGFLMEKYAQDKPLSLSGRLVFEQSYSGVEGDSASSTELYALLSELSGLPVKQEIAVTGSVNQRGEVQAIGGVNEKIEGFFEVCKAGGLTGGQGVLIPASNVQHLMLKEEVVDAVRLGQFHIWSANTIDEGIEILTGVKAGVRDQEGNFEPGSVNDRVNQRLHTLAHTIFAFGREEEKEKKEKVEDKNPA
ncbi:MAG: AAA family ATPase [Chloroflexi bacterium]|nr:AAA family ATPase [Chloroflexota bacterium]